MLRLGCLVLLATTTLIGTVAAQNAATQPTSPEALSVSRIDSAIKQVSESESLEAAVKQAATEWLNKAREELLQRDAAIEKGQSFRKKLETLSADLQVTRQEIANLPQKPRVEPEKLEGLDAVLKQLSEIQTQLDDPERGLKKQVATLEAEAATRANRLKELPMLATAVQAELDEIKKQLEAPAPDNEAVAVTQSRLLQLRARQDRLERRLAQLQAELQWSESSEAATLLREQRDLLNRRIALLTEESHILAERRDQLRKQEAAEQLYMAQREAALAHPLLRPLADDNQALAERNHQQTEENQSLSAQVDEAKAKLATIKTESDRITQMAEALGLSESIGLLLRRQRQVLPVPNQIEAEIDARREKVRESRLELFNLDNQLAALSDVASSVKSAIETLKLDDQVLTRETLRAQAEELLKRKRELVSELHASTIREFDLLVSLDSAQQALADEARKARNYVDERVLWIRSGDWLEATEARLAMDGVRKLVHREDWATYGKALAREPSQHPATYLVAGLGLFVIVGCRFWARRRLWELGDLAADGACRDYGVTLQATALTLFLGGWPAFGWFLAWRAEAAAPGTELAMGISAALGETTTFLLMIELLRTAACRRGLFQQHFHWNVATIRRIHNRTRNVLLFGTPAVLLTSFLISLEESPEVDALGRFVFIGLMLVLQAFALRVTAVSLDDIADDPDTRWATRWWRMGRIAAWVVPSVLIALTVAGFYYSAQRLTLRVQETVAICLAIVVMRALVVRWISMQRKRLAIRQAQEQRALAESELQQERQGPLVGREEGVAHASRKFDLGLVVNQVRRLLDASLWTVLVIGMVWTWSEVVPALTVFNNWTVWETTVDRSTEAVDENGEKTIQTVSVAKSVTVMDVLIAILVFALAVVLLRNIPGLMNVTVLEHMPLDTGLRDAFSLFVRYAIVTVGVIVGFSQLGIGWSKVQWLVAAASVGLGFGLQEIFANFVSGIILLFERPLRVGDVVTIGDVTGSVARIQFRATTIQDWDCKELIVPNKELVTGKLVNWTLSNKTNRLEFRVAVAHGTDPNRVRELLLDIAKQYPHVLPEPAPHSVMDGFGDSTLRFVLRVYLPTLDVRLQTTHDLHTNIVQRFREEGISIAFPQMDLHVIDLPRGSRTGEAIAGPSTNGHTTHVAPAENSVANPST